LQFSEQIEFKFAYHIMSTCGLYSYPQNGNLCCYFWTFSW